jgi:hypothetical protein
LKKETDLIPFLRGSMMKGLEVGYPLNTPYHLMIE